MKNAVTIQSWNDEEHIVSVIIHARPERLTTINLAMEAIPGVERVANDGLGKEVILISASSAKKVMQRIEQIQELEGVLSASMVAHHTETAESLEEEIELSSLVRQHSEQANESQITSSQA
ncbi:chaperone NapD [Reinekea marina]|uniref:Chaperone NapD n=1 Tax=Reinekea marina TaxID=1310421 RepID=A0ABV7WU95_9GAMM|nr:chaperone NapD [Reinekea marina]MDN3648786.1 chaperone NapD [Reinekea marina]